jgi:hypothetical protein
MEHNKAPHGFAQLIVYGDIRELTLAVGFTGAMDSANLKTGRACVGLLWPVLD